MSDYDIGGFVGARAWRWIGQNTGSVRAKTSDARSLAATRERMLELTSDVLRQMPLPTPREGDKKARGDVLLIGGSVEVPGAALLAGTAALRAGAGRLRVAACRLHATLLGLSTAFTDLGCYSANCGPPARLISARG